MSFVGGLFGGHADHQSAVFDPNQYANNGAQNQTRDQQQQFVNALQAQASGQGPSASQTMLQNALSQQQGQTQGLMSAQRGMNPALAAKLATEQNTAAANNAMAQGVAARQQEQMTAQGMLGQGLAQMRGQDIQNAGMYNGLGAQYANINAGVDQSNASNNLKAVGSLMQGGGSAASMVAAMSRGGRVHGSAEVVGDSPKNDTVPTMLSPGEIVVPRSKASDPEKAKEFIDHLMSRKKANGGESGFGKVLEAHRKLGAALEAHGKKVG